MSEPSFLLAIDVGNSRVSAAVARGSRESYDNPALFSLGANEPSASSAAYVAEDGTLFFGDEAARRGSTSPQRVVREFAHDVGDDVPVLIGEHSVLAEDLVARMCAWIVDEVTAAEGAHPALVALTHPTSWGGHRLSRLRTALERAGIDAPMLVSESEASARQSETALPLDPGQMIAVYDLGGTRFDARVLRQRSGGRFAPVGEQVSIERLGGADFDDELMRHVLSSRASDVSEAPAAALTEVRGAIIKARELLSSAGDATVPLGALAGGASVRITRSELEGMIGADLDRTVEALDLAIESADAHGDRLKGIVLAGGSSRTPLVAQRLSERFDVPIVGDADTKAATALGAARIACDLIYGIDAAADAAPAPSARTAQATAQWSEQWTAPKNAHAPDQKTTPQEQPEKEPQAQPVKAAAFLRALFTRPSRTTSPALLAVAAVFIAATIVLSSTTAAGTRWPDFITEAASTIMSLPKPHGDAPAKPSPAPNPAPTAAPQVPGTESGIRPVSSTRSDAGAKQTPPKNRQSGPKVEPTSPSNDSGGSTRPDPATPGSTNTGTSPTTGGQTGTTPPPADTGNPTTTPPPATTPTDPVPDDTPQNPTPPPTPENTTPDGPAPTDPTTPPADPPPPAENPAPENPAPASEASLTETSPTSEQQSGPAAPPT